MELPESASLTNSRAVGQAHLSHQSAAGLGDGVPTSGGQGTAEAAVAAGAGSGQGRDSGRKAGPSRAVCGSRGTESHKQGHVEGGEVAAAAAVGQEEQLREDAALQGAIPCRIPALAFMALTMRGSWGCPGAAPAQHSHLPCPLPAAVVAVRGSNHSDTNRFSFGGITVGKRQFSTALMSGPTFPGLPAHELYTPVSTKCCRQPRQRAGRRAPAGCGAGAMGAIGAPGTAKGAPTQNRSHSAAVCIVCTRQCLTTAFTLFRMEKLPFILLVSNPYVLNHQFTREFSLELRQELFLQQHSWIFSLLLNY